MRPRSWWSCSSPKRSASSITITVAFGTSTPTSMTVVATSTSVSPSRNARIAASLSAAGIWPCSSPSRRSASSSRLQPLELLGGGPRLELVGALDQRAHHVGLAPLRHLLAHLLVHRDPFERSAADHRRLDRRAAGREVAQLGLVEVAVDEHRRGARDRRGRHHQHVGRVALARAAGRAARRRSGAARRSPRRRGWRTRRRRRSARGCRRGCRPCRRAGRRRCGGARRPACGW